MPTNITIKNTNQRNELRVTPEVAEIDPKTKKKTWTASVDGYLKPGTSVDVWVGEDRRIVVQEVPT